MVKRYAVIKGERVFNVILLAEENYDDFVNHAGPNYGDLVMIDDDSPIDNTWNYVDGEFVDMTGISGNGQDIVNQIVEQIADT
jgi:hypothetical protein